MRRLVVILLVLSCFVGAPLLAIHGGQKLEGTSDKLLRQLLYASGSVSMISSNPVKATKSVRDGSLGLLTIPFEQAGCSATYIQTEKMALFLTSALCFSGEDMSLDPHRRIAQVTVNGKYYDIDPLSIIIHHEYSRGTAESDLAVFSLEPSQEATFASSHTGIPVIPQDTWITEGQLTQFVGSGALSEMGGEYGTAHTKEFIQLYPDAADRQAAAGNLEVSPLEQVLSFVTKDGKKGGVCPGDSGGGGLVKLNTSCDEKAQWYLQSVVIGWQSPMPKKIDEEGNEVEYGCEEVNKYIVNVDLRFEHDWLNQAVEKIKSNRAQAKAQRDKYAAIRKSLYPGNNDLDVWVSIPASELQSYIDSFENLSPHQINRQLYLVMKSAQKIREARKYLSINHTKEITVPTEEKDSSVFTKLTVPNPWAAPTGWVSFDLSANSRSYRTRYVWKNSHWLDRIRIRNVGTKTISFDRADGESYRTDPSWNESHTLNPGRYVDLDLQAYGGYDVFTVSSIDLINLTSGAKLAVAGRPVSDDEFNAAELRSWNNYVLGYFSGAKQQLRRQYGARQINADTFFRKEDAALDEVHRRKRRHNSYYGKNRSW